MLDQFCINFTNKRQHHFIQRCLFEVHVNEYKSEGIASLVPPIPICQFLGKAIATQAHPQSPRKIGTMRMHLNTAMLVLVEQGACQYLEWELNIDLAIQRDGAQGFGRPIPDISVLSMESTALPVYLHATI